jgi:hypothetical protein
MPPGDLDRLPRGVDTGDLAAEAGELLGQQAAAAAHVEHLHAVRLEAEVLDQDPAHIAEANRVDPSPQEIEESPLLPPGLAEAVIYCVVYWHRSLLEVVSFPAARIWASY